ncbi:MAG TPA: hypothetical protein VL334_24940 [Anaerolineae bacterium]|nr:hypothetical protein [Anaerolineae bacterium]
MHHPSHAPTVLIVFLENGGRVGGVSLPQWASRALDRSSQAYARAAVWLQARHHYGSIVVLEEELATAAQLWQSLLDAGDATVDVLMLVHGQVGYACGHDDNQVGADFFAGLRRLRAAGLAPFRLRAVYQMNCYGQTLAAEWLSIGAQAVNGSAGVNWLPEPSLSVFLRSWLGGRTFEQAVQRSYRAASRVLGLAWRPQQGRAGVRQPHDKIASSRMEVFGDGELRIG